MKFTFPILFYMAHILGVVSIKTFCQTQSYLEYVMCYLWSFVTWCVTFISMIHFDFVFANCVSQFLNSIFFSTWMFDTIYCWKGFPFSTEFSLLHFSKSDSLYIREDFHNHPIKIRTHPYYKCLLTFYSLTLL